jgi:hypothetical protein
MNNRRQGDGICRKRLTNVLLILVRPMASLLRLTPLAGLLLFVATASHAVVIYEMKLYNASGRPVELVDRSTGKAWATIPAGRTKSFEYYEGVSLRCSGHQFTYTRIDPPSQYISVGLFSTSFKAQLASDFRIYLLPPAVSPPAVQLPPQPKGFPLRPATHGSNQALERTADRRGDLLSMISILKPEAQLALVSGRSACSR